MPSSKKRKKLLFIVNEPTYFISHRLPIAIAAREKGYEVHLATGVKHPSPKLIEEQLIYHYLPISRSGKNIAYEFSTLLSMFFLMKRVQPDIVHLVTTKPVVYGSFIARLARVPAVVAAVSGLGTLFIGNDLKNKILRQFAKRFYRIGFRHKGLNAIFQNECDQDIVHTISALKKEQTLILPGSGVDLTYYQMVEESLQNPPVVIMASRLLKDKGVFEYIEAAKLLHERAISAEFWLAGEIDPGNPTSLKENELRRLEQSGYIKYIGYQTDMARLFAQANLVVLPSYREGLPRVLAEAAACGRAVVTTNVPGCRNAIIPNKTGFLVELKNALDLANKIEQLIKDTALRQQMGRAARKLAEQEFNICTIVERHIALYESIIKKT